MLRIQLFIISVSVGVKSISAILLNIYSNVALKIALLCEIKVLKGAKNIFGRQPILNRKRQHESIRYN